MLCDGNSTEAACSQGAIKNGTDILDQGCSSELNSNNTAVVRPNSSRLGRTDRD